MGLDMYLNRMPRYRGTAIGQVSAIEQYFDWQAREEKFKQCTFEEWSGIPESSLPSAKTIAYYFKYYTEKYYAWDEQHRHPYNMLIENVAYWRKANAIHNWFVVHVQDGEDDCAYHREVTEEDLQELLDTCQKVLESCVMIQDKVTNGYTFSNGTWGPELEDGMTVLDPTTAKELLPTTSGFFFGGTEYDQWYVEDLVYTIKTLQKVLAETDFDKYAIYYRASW